MEKIQIQKDSRILIIAPHPDDETYGCGGVLLTYKGQCDVVLLAYGETGNPNWTKDRTRRVRRDEFRKAMEMAGAANVIELGITNKRVDENLSEITGLDYSAYDYIFVPSRKDQHPDHRCVLRAVKHSRSLRKDTVILQYEMWGMMEKPTHYLDITGKIEDKEELMLVYKSQEERIPYCSKIKAKDYYRAMGTYDKKCQYAEVFYLEPAWNKRFVSAVKEATGSVLKSIALKIR